MDMSQIDLSTRLQLDPPTITHQDHRYYHHNADRKLPHD